MFMIDGFYNADLHKNSGHFFILPLSSLINSKGAKGRRNKPIKKRFASLHSALTRSQATQYARTPTLSSNGVADVDRLKTILFIVLGLLVGLIIIIIPITLVIKFWYRRKYKPPASGKKANCTGSQFRTERLVVRKSSGQIVYGFYQQI